MLDKYGKTDFQRKVSEIIKQRLNTSFFNNYQEKAIKIIWGLSKEQRNQKSQKNKEKDTRKYEQKTLFPLNQKAEPEPNFGVIPENLKFDQNVIINSHQYYSSAVIIGPPGTGKTIVIVNGSLLFISAPVYRRSMPIVYIGTPTNESANRILQAFHEFFENNDIEDGHKYVKRVFPKKAKNFFILPLKDYILENPRPPNYLLKEYQSMISMAWIFIGTVFQLQLLSKKYFINPQVILYDEASQLTPPEMYLPFFYENNLSPNIRGSCLVGDNCQLSPITSFTELSTNAIDFAIRKLHFGQQNVPIKRQIMLRKQYRMHPAIRDLSMKFAPGRHIIRDGDNTKQRSHLLQNFKEYNGNFSKKIYNILNPQKTVVIIDTSNIDDAINQRVGSSRYNIGEVNIVRGLFKLIQHTYNFDESNEEFLKLITPYKNQATRLKLIYEKAGTADSFQGQEADIVLISLTLTDCVPSPHIRDNHRLHVMFSRARKKMIIIGRKSTFESPETNAPHIRDIFYYKYSPSNRNTDLGYKPEYIISLKNDFYDFLSKI